MTRQQVKDLLKAQLTTVGIGGKNKFNKDTDVIVGFTVSIGSAYGIFVDSTRSIARVALNASTNYVIDGLPTDSSFGMRFEDANKNLLSGYTLPTGASKPFTTPAGCVYVAFSITYSNSIADYSTVMIREATENSTYEPYGGAQQVTGISGVPLYNPLASWNGKKMVSLGDSITYGFIPRNTVGYPGQLTSYAALTAAALSMTFTNYGITASTIGSTDGTSINDPFCLRYTSMDSTADLVTVMGGINDFRKGVPLGVFGDTVITTFFGALDTLCKGLLQKYRMDQGTTVGAKKTIVFLTPIKNGTTLDPAFVGYVNAVKQVCQYYSIPVLDMYNESGINPHLFKTLQGTETGYTDMYNPYITDATHPTQDGHEIMKNRLVGYLKQLR